MPSISSVKREFLRRWISGMRKYSSKKKNMNLLERKKAIKLSADIAMASTKTTRWSRAVIANASRNDTDQIPLGSPRHSHTVSKTFTNSSSFCSNMKKIRSGKILRRHRIRIHKGTEKVTASLIAKKLLQKRTRRLKSLLPGGELMDDVSLVEETLDYIQSLRAQVEVMRCLVTASELFINNPS